jgi:exoribonuclease II
MRKYILREATERADVIASLVVTINCDFWNYNLHLRQKKKNMAPRMQLLLAHMYCCTLFTCSDLKGTVTLKSQRDMKPASQTEAVCYTVS